MKSSKSKNELSHNPSNFRIGASVELRTGMRIYQITNQVAMFNTGCEAGNFQ